MPDYMVKKLVPFAVAITLVTINSLLPALAKPAKIREGVSFDLEACRRTLDGNDVVCTGTLLSRSGEQAITIERRDWLQPNLAYTYITTSQGKTHGASEISVGSDQVCRSGDNPCHTLSVTLVEGVRYNSSFTFRDVSPTSSKIALLTISFNGGHSSLSGLNSPPLKYRNLSVFQMR
jgi:lactam utilization protein B